MEQMSDGWAIATAIGTLLAALSAGAGLWITVSTFKRTVAIKEEDDLSKQALECLQIAYDVLTEGGRSIPPPRSRINWLTSARQLVRFQQLRDTLTGTARVIVDEAEVVWRHKFYMILRELELAYGYFDPPQPDVIPKDADKIIHPKSALVVIAFSQWPDEVTDPLDDLSVQDLAKGRESLVFRHRAFERSYQAIKEREIKGSVK